MWPINASNTVVYISKHLTLADSLDKDRITQRLSSMLEYIQMC